MKQFPEKGDLFSITNRAGISPRTVWQLISNINKEGIARMKSSKNKKVISAVINEEKFASSHGNPSFKSKLKFKFHNPTQSDIALKISNVL